MGNRRRRKTKKITLMGERRVNPTPETVQKLKPDPLWQMASELGSDRIQAAHEIRQAFKIISAPLSIRVQQWERRDQSYDDHESIRTIHVQQRYNGWVDSMSKEMIPVGSALDLIIEGMSCRQIETLRKWRHGAFKPYFFDAMEMFCELTKRRL